MPDITTSIARVHTIELSTEVIHSILVDFVSKNTSLTPDQIKESFDLTALYHINDQSGISFDVKVYEATRS